MNNVGEIIVDTPQLKNITGGFAKFDNAEIDRTFNVDIVDVPPASRGTVNYSAKTIEEPSGTETVNYVVKSDVGTETIERWVKTVDVNKYYVRVEEVDGINKFVLYYDESYTEKSISLAFVPGNTYIFDQSDDSNENYKINFVSEPPTAEFEKDYYGDQGIDGFMVIHIPHSASTETTYTMTGITWESTANTLEGQYDGISTLVVGPSEFTRVDNETNDTFRNQFIDSGVTPSAPASNTELLGSNEDAFSTLSGLNWNKLGGVNPYKPGQVVNGYTIWASPYGILQAESGGVINNHDPGEETPVTGKIRVPGTDTSGSITDTYYTYNFKNMGSFNVNTFSVKFLQFQDAASKVSLGSNGFKIGNNVYTDISLNTHGHLQFVGLGTPSDYHPYVSSFNTSNPTIIVNGGGGYLVQTISKTHSNHKEAQNSHQPSGVAPFVSSWYKGGYIAYKLTTNQFIIIYDVSVRDQGAAQGVCQTPTTYNGTPTLLANGGSQDIVTLPDISHQVKITLNLTNHPEPSTIRFDFGSFLESNLPTVYSSSSTTPWQEQTLINNGFTKDDYKLWKDVGGAGREDGLIGISYGNNPQAVTFNNIRYQTFSSGQTAYQEGGITNDLSYKSITFKMATLTNTITNIGELYGTITADVNYWLRTVEVPGTETIDYWVKSVENIPPTSSNYYWVKNTNPIGETINYWVNAIDTFVFYVRVDSEGGVDKFKLFYDSEGLKPVDKLSLVAGKTYIFDQTHFTNNNHPMLFSTSSNPNSTSTISEQYTIGTEGSDRVVQLINLSARSAYWMYCTVHGVGMGSLYNGSGGITNSVEYWLRTIDVPKNLQHNYVVKAVANEDLPIEYYWAKGPDISTTDYYVETLNHTNYGDSTFNYYVKTVDKTPGGDDEIVNLSIKTNDAIVYYVKVLDESGNKFVLYSDSGYSNRVHHINFLQDRRYIFDQSEPSNLNHQIRISTTRNTYTAVTQAYTHSTPGTYGAETIFVADIITNPLHYIWSDSTSNISMGAYYNNSGSGIGTHFWVKTVTENSVEKFELYTDAGHSTPNKVSTNGLRFIDGVTYTFDVSDTSNDGHDRIFFN